MGMISYVVPNVFLNEFQFQRGIISVFKMRFLRNQ